jgi:S1-C subfamily serine protease/mono/diheme cytochrome c family protein
MLACALACAVQAAAGPAPAEEMVLLAQYIGSDYEAAVRSGNVANAAEYEEMRRLSRLLLERLDEARPQSRLRAEVVRLGTLIESRAPATAVRSLSAALVPGLVEDLGLDPYPAEAPDLARGADLYREDCASCHGATGDGDGPVAPGMEPPPASFRGPRMNRVSPYQVFTATSYGVTGTDMPSHREGRSRKDLWDVAFFVMTLRGGFDPAPPVETVPLSLRDLASKSNDDLLKRIRESRPGATASEVDYYRQPGARAAPAASAASPSGGADAGVAAAEELERAFARAADRVVPSVVGVSIYEKGSAAARGDDKASGWTTGDAEEDLYPGFRRTRSGSGFLVSEEGHVLTAFDVIAPGEPARKPDVIDVELPGNVHARAKIVGLEPSVGLAVLKFDPPVPVRPAPLGVSDAVRVGQWAIAVGDPPGARRTFAPGTIAAKPERDCYQEHRQSTLLQSSAAIEPAGYGGPLVDIRGNVLGVTVPAPGVPLEASGALLGPVSALPIDLAMTIYEALRVKESERSPWIGISVLDLSSSLRKRVADLPPTGIYIDDVFVPSPASRAGVRVGDVLTAMSEKRILAVQDFQRQLYLLGIDAAVTLEIRRGAEVLRLPVTIEARPDAARLR